MIKGLNMSNEPDKSFYIGSGNKKESEALLPTTAGSSEQDSEKRPSTGDVSEDGSSHGTQHPQGAREKDSGTLPPDTLAFANELAKEVYQNSLAERILTGNRGTHSVSSGSFSVENPMTSSGDSHQTYVELSELSHVGVEEAEWVWLQKARWIKYEEDVETETCRWGKPHVPFLLNHSLYNLKDYLRTAVVLLDEPATTLDELITSVVKAFEDKRLLDATEAALLKHALALPHKHLDDRDHALFYHGRSEGKTFGKRGSMYHILPRNLSHLFGRQTGRKPGEEITTPPSAKRPWRRSFSAKFDTKPRSSIGNASADVSDGTETPETLRRVTSMVSPPRRLSRRESHQHFAITSHLEEGAEGTLVLTGHLDGLQHPIMAVVRLSESRDMDAVIGADVPLKFIFILFGPPSNDLQKGLHETGRSIGALMSNKRFHNYTHLAYGREDLLMAIDGFLTGSIVVPPGRWDKEQLLPSMLQARMVGHEETLADMQAYQLPGVPHAEIDDVKPRVDSFLETKYGSEIGSVRPTYRALEKEEKPPEINPLVRTGRLFGGLINDFKRRYPKYVSDITDGLNAQCLATLFFLYFACLAPAITFGGLLGAKSARYMGISEMLIGISLCGVSFHLLAAQPLMVIGTTGPVLVFEESLYAVSAMLGWEYMSFRFWVCVWLFVITFVVVMFEGSFLIKFVSRFTEEIFAFLISLIFIFEVFNKLFQIFKKYPLLFYYPNPWVVDCHTGAVNGTENSVVYVISQYTLGIIQTLFNTSLFEQSNQTSFDANYTCSREFLLDTSGPLPNTALLSMVLTFGTFGIAYYFRLFRHMHFLGKTARRVLADFGIPISIFVMVLIDFLIPEVYTEKLDVPGGLSVTDSEKRGWLINPLGIKTPLSYVAMGAAVVPAFLMFILIFMETQITSIIVNKHLKKGTGFHLDLMLVGVFSIVCGTFGLPLISFATVRAISHVNALSVYSSVVAPGDKPKLVEVKEQRLTGIFAHILIGASVLMGPVLRAVPLAVLFGVFLYMGITSIVGMQLTDRLELILKPVKHHPTVSYVTKVRTRKMHLYTLIQVGFLVVLWIVKSSPVSLAFPFVLLLTIPTRNYLLKYIFTERELRHLDSKDGDPNIDEDEDSIENMDIPLWD